MTAQVISMNLQFECFDVRLCLKKIFFPVLNHKFFAYDYVFDAVLCI